MYLQNLLPHPKQEQQEWLITSNNKLARNILNKGKNFKYNQSVAVPFCSTELKHRWKTNINVSKVFPFM